MSGFNFEGYLNEANEYLKQGDPVQSSEKLYKCAEEAVKLLAEKLNLPEYQIAHQNGKWNASLLFKAAGKLTDKIEKEFYHWWGEAWNLHVEGFHERRMDLDEVKRRFKDIANIVKVVKNYAKSSK